MRYLVHRIVRYGPLPARGLSFDPVVYGKSLQTDDHVLVRLEEAGFVEAESDSAAIIAAKEKLGVPAPVVERLTR